MTSVRLVDDNGVTLLSIVDGGVTNPMLSKLDLGYPTVRAVSTPLSGQDGEDDVTKLMGARAVVAEALIMFGDAPDALADTIRALMHPGRRYWLHALLDGWPAERRIRVRGATLSLPMGPLPWALQLGWAAPSPTFQDVTPTTITLSPASQPGGGATLPLTFPFAFQPGLVPGASNITVAGTANAYPVIDIYGPCTDPLFRVVGGDQMSFTGLTINAGDYLHIDCAARTITFNNDPAQSQYNRLDFATSSWPVLPPGAVQVLFSPGGYGAGCVANVTYSSQWL